MNILCIVCDYALSITLGYNLMTGASILATSGIINIITFSFLVHEIEWLYIVNTIIYVLSGVGSVLAEEDKYNTLVVTSSLSFRMVAIVLGIIVGTIIIGTPDLIIPCASVTKYECVWLKSVFAKFVGAIYIGSSFLSTHLWLSGYSFYRWRLRRDENLA